jgi:hypothetical protein
MINILLLVETHCFVNRHSKANYKYKQDEIIQMLDFLIDNIFVLFGGRVFQQTIGIPMGTNCASLLADLFLHAIDADFLQGLSRIKIENYTRPLIPSSVI